MFRQMEKLIELLNEYLSPFSGYIQYHNENGFKRTPTKSAVEGDRMLQDEYVLGKSFGFIKWLVENEKIDYEKIEKQTKCKNIVGGKEFLDFDIERDFTPYEEVLMWLAIQDEPIEFLVSILK